MPPVLLSGHHANIEQWRRQRSLALTAKRRPDLIQKPKIRVFYLKDLSFLAQLAENLNHQLIRGG